MPPRVKKQTLPHFTEEHFFFFFNSILAGAALLYSFLNPYYRTGVINDDAVFILGARNLWNRAAVPSFVIRPDYPLPGLPLLLAPFIKLVAPYWTRLEWVVVIVTLVLVYVTGLWVRRFLSAGETLAVTFLLAFNPLIAKFSGIVMPSIPYTLAAVASFFLWGELLEKSDLGKALALGSLLGWAALIRPEGFLLVASVLGTMALTPAGRRLLPKVMLPLPVFGLIFLFWCHWFKSTGTAYGGDLMALAAYWEQNWVPGLSFAHNLLQNTFLNSLITLRFSSSPIEVGLMLLFLAMGAVAMGMGVRHLWDTRRELRSVWIGVGLFCVSHFGVHLFWHVAVARYSIPLLPFLILALVHGANRVLSRSPSKGLWTTLLLAGLFISYVHKSVYAIYDAEGMLDPQKSPPWQSLDWIRANTAPGDLLMSEIAPSIELYADRSAYPGVSMSNIDIFLDELAVRDVKYILDRNVHFLAQGVGTTDDPNKYWRLTRLKLTAFPNLFHLVYENPTEQTRIYQVVVGPEFSKAYDLVRTAYHQYQAGQLDDASRTAQSSLELFPRMGSAIHLLAVISWRKNDFSRAEQFFLKAMELMPTSTKVRINLATLYHETGNEERSRAAVQQAFDISVSRGEEDKFNSRMKEVYHQWDQRHGLILLDIP